MIPNELKEEYPFEQNKFNISDKYSINYVDEGDGEPILMVHGNPTWSFYYRNLIKEFSKTNRTIAVDNIGCGLSDKPQDYEYTLDNHINNLEKLVKDLNLKDITLIVHDWGGAIGMGYATRNPNNIKKVVILNTGAFRSNQIPLRISLCRMPIIGEFIVRAFNAFAYPATFMAVTKKLTNTIKKGFLLPYNNYKNRIAVANFVKDIPMTSDHISYETLLNVENKLKDISCKKLILWGRHDFCFDNSFLKKWQEVYPEATTHICETAGHYVLEDAKDETIAKIKEFLKS